MTTSTDNSGMTDAELTATIREVGQRQIDAAFETSPVAQAAPLPTAELRNRFGDHFDYLPDQGVIQAFDAPRGARGRMPVMLNGTAPAPFDTALASLLADDDEITQLAAQRASLENTFGVSRIAAAWAHRQNPQGSPQDGTTSPAAATASAMPETPPVAILRDTAISRMKSALAAGNGPRRIGIF